MEWFLGFVGLDKWIMVFTTDITPTIEEGCVMVVAIVVLCLSVNWLLLVWLNAKKKLRVFNEVNKQ